MKNDNHLYPKLIYAFFLASIFPIYLAAQSIPIKKDFAKAYEKNTRSISGKPGVNYWQNSSNYTIKASINSNNTQLQGEASIVYFNNSNDTLDRIVLHIAQDLYKKGVTRNQAIHPGDITEGVVLSNLIVAGKAVDQFNKNEFRRTNTNVIIKLANKIIPHSSIQLSMGWKFHIPQYTHLRMGKGDESSYFIAYWYPEVAVYDDVNGWDMSDYEGVQEFYHDVHNFDVSIEASNEYGIWATGELQNAEEVYQTNFIEKMTAAFASDKVTRLIGPENYANQNLPFTKSTPTKSWKFKADNCPDFAFTFGKNYYWDASSTVLKNGKRIKVSAVYRPEAKDFEEVTEFSVKALNYLSNELPGMPYPYPQMTVVHSTEPGSGGGMEFPMICGNPTVKNRGRTADVTSHEIAHTWFPFFVLTNESRYAWMDEGWAAFLPIEYMKRVEPSSNRLSRYVKELNNYTYGYANDLPIITPSHSLDVYNYFGASYSKPALAYYFLQDELGVELFAKTLYEYINRWQFKHPIPYDFFYSFNDISGRNLDWFWRKWFFESNEPDLSIQSVTATKKATKISIQRMSELPVPIALKIIYADGSEENKYQKLSIWEDGKTRVEIWAKPHIKSLILGNEYIPDINLDNNIYPHALK